MLFLGFYHKINDFLLDDDAFDDFHAMMDSREAEAERIRKEREEQERKRAEEEKRREEFRARGVCQHCGGEFKKALLGMKCASCGMKKDYK